MRGFVDIRPKERRVTFGAFGTLFSVTAGHTLLETARDAMFLAKLPASRLPWMYIAIAAVGLLIARLSSKNAKKGALYVALAASAGVTVGFWLLASRPSDPLLYGLFIWTGTFGSWILLELWLLLGTTFDVGQAKRIFGFIGAGSVLGATAGAGLARALATSLEARHLLLAGALMFVLSALPLLLVTGAGDRAPARVPVVAGPPPKRRSLADDLRHIVGDRYLARIMTLVLLATLTLTTVDYVFKAGVATRYPPEQLGATFASIYFVLNATALLVQLGLVAFILRTAGVHRALFLLPVLLAMGGAGLAVTGALAGALAVKAFDGALRHSLHRTTVELLYLPLKDEVRSRAKPVIDLVAQRGGQAVGSLVILGAVSLGAGERTLAVGIAVLASGWLLVSAGIARPYLDVFRATLKRGRFEAPADLPDLDLDALEALFAALNSPRDAEVIGALDLLAAQRRHRLVPALILYHPSQAIVLRALELFAEEGRLDFLPITDRLLEHADAEVRAAALRARASVAYDEAALTERLSDKRPELRATALIALMSKGGLDEDKGRLLLETMGKSEDVLVRSSLARAMSEEPSMRFVDAVAVMAAAEGVAEVRLDIARAMGHLGALMRSSGAEGAVHPDADRLLHLLIRWLPRRLERPVAREAIAAFGDMAVTFIDARLEDRQTPLEVARCLPRVLADLRLELVIPVLFRHFAGHPDGVVRFRCLKTLARLGLDTPDLAIDRARVEKLALETVEHAFGLIDRRVTLETLQKQDDARKTAASQLLTELFHDKQRYAMGRLFLLLGLLFPGERFERIQRGLASTDSKARASSRELLDGVLTGPLKSTITLLVDDLDDAERVRRAAAFYQAKSLDYVALLTLLAIEAPDVASLARYHALELGVELSGANAESNATYDAFTRRVRAGSSPPNAEVAHA